MNFFKVKTSWSNAEFIVLKLCIATAYLLIGAWFSNYILMFYIPIAIVFGITVIWAVVLWLKKMKTSKS
jgi:hypothetical protein